MRRNRELNTWEKKDLARRKYAERQLQKFIDWSIEAKGYLNDVQEELMDAILYIQAAKEELNDNSVNETIAEVNKASFRPPHPSHALSAQQDWDDAISPI